MPPWTLRNLRAEEKHEWRHYWPRQKRAEKKAQSLLLLVLSPHCGSSGTPFIKSMTGAALISLNSLLLRSCVEMDDKNRSPQSVEQ